MSKRRGASRGLRPWRFRAADVPAAGPDEPRPDSDGEPTRTWLPTPDGNRPQQDRDPADERALWARFATDRPRSAGTLEEVPGSWLRGAPLAAEPEETPAQRWLPAEERGPESFVSEEPTAPRHVPEELAAPPHVPEEAAAASQAPEESAPPPQAPEAPTAPSQALEEPPTSPLAAGEPPKPAPMPEPVAEDSEPVRVPTEFEPQVDPRQWRAVESYCRELCPAETAAAAVDEILKSFSSGDDLDLLRHTRSVAATYADAHPHRRGWRRAHTAERESECRSTPSLVAASLNGELDDAGRAKLEDHLRTCVACQAAELRAHRADRAFAAVTGVAIATGTAAAVADAPSAVADAPSAAAEAASTEEEAPPTDAEVMPIARTSVEEVPPVHSPEPDVWRPSEVLGGDAEILTAAEPEPKTAEIPAATAAGMVAAAAATTAAGATGHAAATDEAAPPPTSPNTEPARQRRRPRRRALAGILAALATAGVAAAVTVALVSGGSNKHAAPAANRAARATTPTHRPATRQKSGAATKRPAQSVATHPAPSTPAPSPAPAAASSTPPSSSAPNSAPSSSPSASSAAPSPAPSASAPAPSSPAPSQPSVSIQQPSLGNASASQGIGHH